MNPITLPVAELKPALTGLGKIISKRSTLPVLGCVLVRRNSDGWITLAATDLDSTATVRLEQPGEGGPVSLLIPFAELQKTAKSCKSGEEIAVEGTGNQVTLRYPIGSQFTQQKIDSFPAEEFPPLPQIDGTPVKLEPSVRSSLLDAMQCASTDETRVILNGAYLDVSQPAGHYVVATDGRHLFSSNSFKLPLKESAIIPDHRFLSWKPFAEDGEWQLTVSKPGKDTGHLRIESRRWSFVCAGIEGNYPNWRQVVPAGDFSTTIEVEEGTDELIRTIERMPDHDDVNHGIGLEVNGRELGLLGKSKADEKWSRVEVQGKATGKAVTIFLNRQFLSKALRFGLTRIEISDPMSPLRFSNAGRQMIVMPTRPSSFPPNHPAPASAPASPTETDSSQTNPKERKPMPENNGTNGAQRAGSETEKPALEAAIAQIDSVKMGFREAITGLSKLTDLLRQAAREQKAGDKEIKSVRQTLRSLQGVRI